MSYPKLEPGMRIKVKCGRCYVVEENNRAVRAGNKFLNIARMNERLEHDMNDFSVIAIFEQPEESDPDYAGKLIWKREE